MRILVATDSFKGSMTSTDASRAIARGWASIRPSDQLDVVPLADGGEGTAEAIAAAFPNSRACTVAKVQGPDGRPTRGQWYDLGDGVAVVDLAQMCGLPLMQGLDPMGAHTFGLGEVVAAAVQAGAQQVWIGLGGSASTDAGLGALTALGLRVTDETGADLAKGGGSLRHVHALDESALTRVPGGVVLLTDVTSPLFGPDGAAAVFAPQKGATPAQVRALDQGLRHLAAIAGGDPSKPGAGAAGGTGYGFARFYAATIRSGAEEVSRVHRLDQRLRDTDLVITGEGSFDHQSLQGKLVGNLLQRADSVGTRCAVVAGVVGKDPGVPYASLSVLAGSSEQALADPQHWAEQAGAALARNLHSI